MRSTTASSWTACEHVSIASLAPDLFCVTFSGLSKSHMIAGYRIGWMVLERQQDRCTAATSRASTCSRTCACAPTCPAQSIVQTALGGHQSVERATSFPAAASTSSATTSTRHSTSIPGVTCGQAQGGVLHLPEARRREVQHHRRRAVRPRPAAREEDSHHARRRLQLEASPTTSASCTCRASRCSRRPSTSWPTF